MTTRELLKAQQGLEFPWELEGSPHHTMHPTSLPRPHWKCYRKKPLNRARGQRIAGTFHVYQASHVVLVDCVGGGSGSPGCLGETSQ